MGRQSDPSNWHSVDDVHAAAARRLPRTVLDYIDGGADLEETLLSNREAFRRQRFRPRVLRNVQQPDPTVTLFGYSWSLPLGLAPTGYTRMIHPGGEKAVRTAAHLQSVPYSLSTMSSTRLEEVIAIPSQDAQTAPPWFQLYMWKDRELTRHLIRRAAAAGYEVLEVAVDMPTSGKRLRDLHSGLTIPPRPSIRTVVDIARRPGYWRRLLSSGEFSFANVAGWNSTTGAAYTIADITAQFDPSASWETLEEIRDLWPGRLVLKGPVGPEDAGRAAEAGVDGLHLSNHGGRQLDRSAPPLESIADVRGVVGQDMPVLVDSGIRSGADLALAIAYGADFGVIGRPYLWGLAAAGQAGVARVITVIAEEFRRTLQLLGVVNTAELRSAGSSILAESFHIAT